MKTIIFDFDGTLADTIKISHEVMNGLAERFGFKKLSHDDVKRLKELPARQVLAFLGIAAYKVPFVMAAGKKKIYQRIDEVELAPHFRALLKHWSPDCRIGVVSTNSAENIRRFLGRHEVAEFDFIYADARLSGKARTLKRAIKKQKLDVAQTVYVGDEIRDIKAAREAGLKVIAVTWGYNTKASLQAHEPDYLVDNITELGDALADVF